MSQNYLHELSTENLLERAIRGIIAQAPKRQEHRWSIVCGLSLGSTYAYDLCVKLGIDPNGRGRL